MIGQVYRSVLHRAVLIRGQSRVINSGSRPRGTVAHERVGDALSLLGHYHSKTTTANNASSTWICVSQ